MTGTQGGAASVERAALRGRAVRLADRRVQCRQRQRCACRPSRTASSVPRPPSGKWPHPRLPIPEAKPRPHRLRLRCQAGCRPSPNVNRFPERNGPQEPTVGKTLQRAQRRQVRRLRLRSQPLHLRPQDRAELWLWVSLRYTLARRGEGRTCASRSDIGTSTTRGAYHRRDA